VKQPSSFELSDYQWLVSPVGQAQLDWAAQLLEDAGAPSPALQKRLRNEVTAKQARLLTEQIDLRQRGQRKFGELAKRMLFTRRQLEQASSLAIARYKTQRFPGGAIADLCCGIGGDLLALMEGRQSVVGVDQDPIATLLATHNCAAAGGSAEVRCGDACEFLLAQVEAWHIDPDRRIAGRRTTQVTAMSPSADQLTQMLKQNATACIKLAPATKPPADWEQVAQWEWIGEQRECKGLLAWFGDMATRPGVRRATVLHNNLPHTLEDDDSTTLPSRTASLGTYLYEPHATVLAAGLDHAFARRHALSPFNDHGGYLTGDTLLRTPLAAAFEVIAVTSHDSKKVRAAVRARNLGVNEMKARGVPLDEPIRRKLRAIRSTENVTLLLCQAGGKRQAILAKRVE